MRECLTMRHSQNAAIRQQVNFYYYRQKAGIAVIQWPIFKVFPFRANPLIVSPFPYAKLREVRSKFGDSGPKKIEPTAQGCTSCAISMK